MLSYVIVHLPWLQLLQLQLQKLQLLLMLLLQQQWWKQQSFIHFIFVVFSKSGISSTDAVIYYKEHKTKQKQTKTGTTTQKKLIGKRQHQSDMH